MHFLASSISLPINFEDCKMCVVSVRADTLHALLLLELDMEHLRKPIFHIGEVGKDLNWSATRERIIPSHIILIASWLTCSTLNFSLVAEKKEVAILPFIARELRLGYLYCKNSLGKEVCSDHG